MSVQSLPATLTEFTLYTGPYQGTNSNLVATMVFQLSNTPYRAIVRFYDIEYGQLPSNGVYSTDYNVSLPLGAMGGLVGLYESGRPMTFHFDTSNYHARFTG